MLPTDFIVKVMEYEANNKREVQYTKEFADLVLDGISPNFALCWEDHNCADKCAFIDTTTMRQPYQGIWNDIKKRERS
jgi:hypothetical protein